MQKNLSKNILQKDYNIFTYCNDALCIIIMYNLWYSTVSFVTVGTWDGTGFRTMLYQKKTKNTVVPIQQRWAKGPIDRYSDTDSIDVKFRFLYRPIVSVRFEFRFFNRPICFLVLSSDFCIGRLCRFVLSSDSLIVRSCFLVLSYDFCIVRLCRPVLNKKIAVQAFLGRWLRQNSSFVCSWLLLLLLSMRHRLIAIG